MSRTTARLLAVTAGTLLVAPVLAGPLHAAPETAGRPFTVEMSGDQEAPDPGDPDGAGNAMLHVNPGLGRVCYSLEVTGVADVVAAHVHVAPAGEPGPVVIPLEAPTMGSSSACADADRELLVDILRDPDQYYVNVHSVAFPAGAVRGQLG